MENYELPTEASNSFKNWWIRNKAKIEKISRFWLLPKGLKVVMRIIVAAIDIYLTSDEDTSVDTVLLKDVNVSKIETQWA